MSDGPVHSADHVLARGSWKRAGDIALYSFEDAEGTHMVAKTYKMEDMPAEERGLYRHANPARDNEKAN